MVTGQAGLPVPAQSWEFRQFCPVYAIMTSRGHWCTSPNLSCQGRAWARLWFLRTQAGQLKPGRGVICSAQWCRDEAAFDPRRLLDGRAAAGGWLCRFAPGASSPRGLGISRMTCAEHRSSARGGHQAPWQVFARLQNFSISLAAVPSPGDLPVLATHIS